MNGNEEESLLKNQNSNTNDHPQKRVVIISAPYQNQEVKKTRMETDALQIMKEPYTPKPYTGQNQKKIEKKTSNRSNEIQVTETNPMSTIQSDVIDNLLANRKNNSYSHYNLPNHSINQMQTHSISSEFNKLDEPSLILDNYSTVGFSNNNNNMDFISENENTSCCSICNISKKKEHSSSGSEENKNNNNKNDENSTKSTDTEFSSDNPTVHQSDHNLTSELLPQVDIEDMDKLCLVVDLDETLVHSSTTPNKNSDMVLTLHNPCMDSKKKASSNSVVTVYVNFRPGAEEFIANLAPLYEIVFFTTSGKEYADLVINKLDPCHMVKHRLFRENCTELGGNFVKDLSRMNRDLDRIIIIDNNPISYMLQPGNAIAISSWFEDPKDKELTILQQFLIRNASAQSISEIFR